MNNKLKNVKLDPSTIAPIIFLATLMLVYTITTEMFFTGTNFMNILRQASITGIMAVGVTMVILLGQIDLSIATVMAFSGMISSGLSIGMYFGLPPLPVEVCILVSLTIGALIGFISGIAVAKLAIPGFMATLAMMFIVDGLMLMLTNAQPIFGLSDRMMFLGSARVFDIPVIIFVFLFVLIIGILVLKYSVFGRNLYAIGGNKETARISGINVTYNVVAAFMVCSILASLAGVLMVGRIGSGQVTAGQGLQLPPIAAAVLGGASLLGGKGTLIGTLLGVLTMGVLVNGLNLLGQGSAVQWMVTGLVLFLAVAFNMIMSRRSQR